MMVAMVVSISVFDGRAPTQPRMDGSGPRDGCASITFPQRLSRLFSPAAKWRHSSRKAKKPSATVLRYAAGLTAAGRSLPGPRTAIEAAMVAARQQTETTPGYHRHFHRVGQRLRRIGQDARAQRQGEVRRDRKRQRQGTRFSHLRRHHRRVRRRLEEDRPRQRSRISLGQARRSELPGPDLRLAGEGRGRRRLHADLVPPQRRLIQPDRWAPPSRRRGLLCAMATRAQKDGGEDLRSPCLQDNR
jgi:hypothetical protein